MAEVKKEEVAPCCPPGSIGRRPTSPHVPKSEFKKVGDMEVYTAGEGKSVIDLETGEAFW